MLVCSMSQLRALREMQCIITYEGLQLVVWKSYLVFDHEVMRGYGRTLDAVMSLEEEVTVVWTSNTGVN